MSFAEGPIARPVKLAKIIHGGPLHLGEIARIVEWHARRYLGAKTQMDRVLHRHFALVIMMLIAVAALLDAQGIAHVVAARLVTNARQLSVAPLAAARTVVTPESPHATSADAILVRNPFDSVTSPVPDDVKRSVRRVSATEFEIDRGVVDRILDQQALLMQGVQVVPQQENGRIVGIRLFGIRPDALLGLLGLENGDRLQRIDGFQLGSPEQILEAYARLRGADHLTVNVDRRGREMNIDFFIR